MPLFSRRFAERLTIMRFIPLCCLFLLLVATCGKTGLPSGKPAPKLLLGEQQLVEVLTDVQIANAAVDRKIGGTPDSKQKQRQIYLDAVLQKHQISKQDFWENYNYYAAQPEKMDTVYAQIKQKLDQMMPLEEDRMIKHPPKLPPAPPTPKPVQTLPPPQPLKK